VPAILCLSVDRRNILGSGSRSNWKQRLAVRRQEESYVADYLHCHRLPVEVGRSDYRSLVHGQMVFFLPTLCHSMAVGRCVFCVERLGN